MEIWNWFKGIGSAYHTIRKRNKKKLDPKIAQAFNLVKHDIKTLKNDLADTNAQLDQQNNRIAQNNRLINSHAAQLDKLEDIVSAVPIAPSLQNNPTNRLNQPTSRPSQPTNRLIESTNRLVATKPTRVEHPERLDMDSITEQEKRIIGVFLAHRDMSLSYQDVAKSLDKSPNTVKNQMRQINIKANLFDRMIDSQNKNRFKLRKHLKVQANLGGD